jgi:hypothetical protein
VLLDVLNRSSLSVVSYGTVSPMVVFEKEGDKMIVNVKGANFDECSQLPMMAEDVCGMLYTVNVDVIGPIDENSSTDDWGVKLLTEQVQ